MKYLVIGGAGYVGSHFVAEASRQGHDCYVFDNLSLGHKESVADCKEFIKGDVRRSVTLANAIDTVRPDAIFHYAANALVGESVENPALYYDNNVTGTKTLMEVLSRSAEKPPLVFSSSCAVFGTPDKLPITEDEKKSPESPYGRSKLVCEFMISDFCAAYDLRAFALRYFNAAGADQNGKIGESHSPETHLIPNVLFKINQGEKLEIFGGDYDTDDGTCVRDYIHVTDLAQSHLIAAEKLLKSPRGFFQALNIGSGAGYSNLEIVKQAEAITGKKVDYEIASRRAGDPAKLFADISKTKEVLGFQPKYSGLENILKTAWNWHQNPKF